MAKKTRQRISYVLEHPNCSPGGHRLGVNGLAVDRDKAILYSGGRDGVVCAWDLHLAHAGSRPRRHAGVIDTFATPHKSTDDGLATRFRSQTQAHTHWINDIALAQGHATLVSASSDMLVKAWRPPSGDDGGPGDEPATIGQHADYVKCVAVSSQRTGWVASGGLDRKICVWDLAGAGKTLEMDVRGGEVEEKGSVYALGTNETVLASGGPDNIVRLWDPKSGTRITRLVGHTDNVRAILVNGAGDTVMTASSDQTIKVWSVTAGRCMHTFTMHSDSVWSLFSDDPALDVFYSSDRSGLVVKTDVRGTQGEMDDGLSVAVAQENEGVSKLVAWGDHIWTATSRSSIHRWASVDTQLPEMFPSRRSVVSGRGGEGFWAGASAASPPSTAVTGGGARNAIPVKAMLRISNTASFPPAIRPTLDDRSSGKGADGFLVAVENAVEPVHQVPEETVEGQFGLVKHRLLSDRRRVLTLDTAGDVLLWDLIQCRPVQSFGKKHLEDVAAEIDTLEAVAPWCSIDTSSGNLTVVLEPYNCFDAEMYADELAPHEPVAFREDQRINLGKWILRYLFANLVDEEVKRDQDYRNKLNETVAMSSGPPTTPCPVPELAGPEASTPSPSGLWAPAPEGLAAGSPAEKGSIQGSRPSQEDALANAIQSVEAHPSPKPAPAPPEPAPEPKTPMDNGRGKDKEKEEEKDKSAKASGTPFGKKFLMTFGSRKLSRSALAAAERPAVADERTDGSESESSHEREVDESFCGVIQRIRSEYDKQRAEKPDQLVETKILPSQASDTPVLRLPPRTKVILQEETSGGNAEVYRGTVATVGADADEIEQRGAMWLGELLLTDTMPAKEPVKVSFVLRPWQDLLPSIAAADGNNRLNANRILRARKILAYVAERLDRPVDPAYRDGDARKPEEYLELYCGEQRVPNTMSLATLRAHIWKGGNDVVLYYKANGRREIAGASTADTAQSCE